MNGRSVKPLDVPLFKAAAKNYKLIVTVEDGIVLGGFGSALAEALNIPVVKIGLPDRFIPHGKRDLLLEKFGLDGKGIASVVKKELALNS
jgi:1-deoxy-D-xylulose-5-phosphate synthase